MNKPHTPLLAITVIVCAVALLRPTHAPAYASMNAESSIAVCALPTLINELMSSDRYAPDREAFAEELTKELNELTQRGRELSVELRELQPDDPAAQPKLREIQELREAIARVQQQNSRRLEVFTAEQIKECNRLVRSSAQAVAEDLGFEFVISSADAEEDLADSVETLFRQITSRPVIMFPEENDITSDVRDDLNLE